MSAERDWSSPGSEEEGQETGHLQGLGKAQGTEELLPDWSLAVDLIVFRLLTIANDGLYCPCFQCGIVYWLFGGAIRNVGSPEHVTKWFQPLQV